MSAVRTGEIELLPTWRSATNNVSTRRESGIYHPQEFGNLQTTEDIVNLNTLAKDITKKEGGKVNLGIGQVKETMRITLTELAAMPETEALKVIRRYRKERR